MNARTPSPRMPLLLAILLSAGAASAVTIGGAPNLADPDTGYGAVGYAYEIGQYEVTNTQYTAFLNAVADTDTNELWSDGMAATWGGIDRTGGVGSYSYTVKTGFANKPVNFDSFYDSIRYVNWLANGSLTGAQDASTTEDGSYTITEDGILDNSITRNPGATIVLPSEDEWYKAAYYDVLSTSYFDYPAGDNAPTGCASPSATSNTANCGSTVNTVSNVGAYTDSDSPNLTYDQGGNVSEWTEETDGEDRVTRGGNWSESAAELAAADRNLSTPFNESRVIGFRIGGLVPVPEPGTGLLVAVGLAALGARRRAAARR